MFYISDTVPGKILNDGGFKRAVANAIGDMGGNVLLDRVLGGWSEGARTPFAADDVPAMDDYISKRVMLETASEDIRTCSALLLTACATAPQPQPATPEQTAQTLRLEANPKKSVIYFYRAGWMGGDISTGFYVDGMRRAVGSAGYFSRVEVEPGLRKLDYTEMSTIARLETPVKIEEVRLDKGKVYFIEERWKFAQGFYCHQASDAGAQALLADLKVKAN
ncbi:hypothetical protein N8I74_07425 [Chitiniphilus purpureus]|uniref:Uncharacterized protein n=1 Tax=Chitiniphilus purpureus TaxID=2981137 RepID=A0ABY6DR89_9NEIS|nr:hypothetical protein [Chitiniphilus sp. CD1]UXY16837.1 hypothetical protein N8I74_07425 [Chitiniphilus sp. CD1]